MDDFVLFAKEKAGLRDIHRRLVDFLQDRLRLREKERATILAPARAGLPFLGWNLYRGTARLRPENRKRSLRRLRARRHQYRTGRIDLDTLVSAEGSLFEHLRHGATNPLRRSWLRKATGIEEGLTVE